MHVDSFSDEQRLEDVVAGLSFENELMSSRLQIARATNSQLQQDQEEELSQQQEAMAISKFDILTNRSHHAKYKNGHEQFKKIMHQSSGRANYFGTPLGKKLYAHAAALSP
jgi:abortive infection bacteriophage resistance protein